jgi:hypothetical protein
MKKSAVHWCLVLIIGWAGLTACTHKMDRHDLVDLMDRYLDAMARNDPSGIQFAGDVKFVENRR